MFSGIKEMQCDHESLDLVALLPTLSVGRDKMSWNFSLMWVETRQWPHKGRVSTESDLIHELGPKGDSRVINCSFLLRMLSEERELTS